MVYCKHVCFGYVLLGDRILMLVSKVIIYYDQLALNEG